MGIDPADDASAFALALLRSAVMVTGLTEDLVDEIPAGAFPGEKPGAVLVEMLSGTTATALAEVDQHDVRRDAADRSHLQAGGRALRLALRL